MPGIVIHKLNAVYWFIPKTGCTTIKTIIAEIIGLDYSYIHSAQFEIIEDFNSFPHYFHFAFVRHPVSRAISCFNNKIDNSGIERAGYINGVEAYTLVRYNLFFRNMTFEQFANAIVQIPIKDADPHFAPQNTLIPRANIYIARFENFEDELIKIFSILRVALPTIPKLNSTKTLFNILVPESLYSYFEKDFVLYGYQH